MTDPQAPVGPQKPSERIIMMHEANMAKLLKADNLGTSRNILSLYAFESALLAYLDEQAARSERPTPEQAPKSSLGEEVVAGRAPVEPRHRELALHILTELTEHYNNVTDAAQAIADAEQAPVSGGLDPRIAKARKLLDDICIDVAFRADESLWARSNEVREMLSEVLISAQQPAPQAPDIKQLRFHLTEALYVVKRGDQLEYAVKSIETALAVLWNQARISVGRFIK